MAPPNYSSTCRRALEGFCTLCWIALSAAGVSAGDGACADVDLRPDVTIGERLDPIVDAAVADGFAGGVAVVRDGALVYERVAGESAGGVPVTQATLFHVASITKYFTAVLVLTAVEEGRINLEDRVAQWVPGSALAAAGVTIADLLSHRSGLGSSYVAEGKRKAAEALAALAAAPIDGERAGTFRYSNDGYDLLALVLETAYGRPYEELLRRLVLEPACLAAPSFWGEVDLRDPAVVGQPLRSPARRLRRRNYGMIGSAGLLVRAVDLVRFEAALHAGRIVSQASLTELGAEREEVSIGRATYGAFLIDHPRLGRYLSARGYQDWGDTAILNHYLEHDLVLAVVTSKGPAEASGEEPFRSRLSREIEETLAPPAVEE